MPCWVYGWGKTAMRLNECRLEAPVVFGWVPLSIGALMISYLPGIELLMFMSSKAERHPYIDEKDGRGPSLRIQ